MPCNANAMRTFCLLLYGNSYILNESGSFILLSAFIAKANIVKRARLERGKILN